MLFMISHHRIASLFVIPLSHARALQSVRRCTGRLRFSYYFTPPDNKKHFGCVTLIGRC
jgi:hypothetical protein